jgi:type I restriction-modification system DNA methylase subunit
LVIGNPPYGDHRGLYKGLGEEPKISKYEDYFVKRSLDSLKPNGVLAMVLPSGWLNRQTQLKNADILEGFRLPNGAFAGTQVGTDIIIFKKISENFYRYFQLF